MELIISSAEEAKSLWKDLNGTRQSSGMGLKLLKGLSIVC